jgi:hypothetical protein
VLRSGAPWRDLPRRFGRHTTCYNRFVRWRGRGVWDEIMAALIAAHDAAMQVIDTLGGGAMFADDPDFLARQVLGAHLADSLGVTVSDAHAHGGKARRQSSLRAATPGDRPPSGCLQHRLRGDRLDGGDMALARTAAPGTGKIIATSAG